MATVWPSHSPALAPLCSSNGMRSRNVGAPEGSGEIKSFPASQQLPGEPAWHRSPCYLQHFPSCLSVSEPTKCLSKAWGSLLPSSRCLFANIFRALPTKCYWRVTNKRHKSLPKRQWPKELRLLAAQQWLEKGKGKNTAVWSCSLGNIPACLLSQAAESRSGLQQGTFRPFQWAEQQTAWKRDLLYPHSGCRYTNLQEGTFTAILMDTAEENRLLKVNLRATHLPLQPLSVHTFLCGSTNKNLSVKRPTSHVL